MINEFNGDWFGIILNLIVFLLGLFTGYKLGKKAKTKLKNDI